MKRPIGAPSGSSPQKQVGIGTAAIAAAVALVVGAAASGAYAEMVTIPKWQAKVAEVAAEREVPGPSPSPSETQTVAVTAAPVATATITVTASAPPSGAGTPSSVTPSGTYSPEEQAYLKANADSMTGAYARSAESVLESGREECEQLGKNKGVEAQARYMLEALPFVLGDYEAPTHLCPEFAPAVKMAKAGFTDGTYTVGTGEGEVSPGTYVTRPNATDCYWERVSDSGETIANDFVSLAPKGVTVKIKSSDGGFKSEGCGTWVPA